MTKFRGGIHMLRLKIDSSSIQYMTTLRLTICVFLNIDRSTVDGSTILKHNDNV